MIPPTFIEETKREFDEQFPVDKHCNDRECEWTGGDDHHFHGEREEIHSFLLSRTSAAYELGRADMKKEVRKMIEEINIGKEAGDERSEGYKQALSWVLVRLTDTL